MQIIDFESSNFFPLGIVENFVNGREHSLDKDGSNFLTLKIKNQGVVNRITVCFLMTHDDLPEKLDTGGYEFFFSDNNTRNKSFQIFQIDKDLNVIHEKLFSHYTDFE